VGRVYWHFGKLGQPQNREPAFAPFLAVLLTSMLPHFAQVGCSCFCFKFSRCWRFVLRPGVKRAPCKAFNVSETSSDVRSCSLKERIYITPPARRVTFAGIVVLNFALPVNMMSEWTFESGSPVNALRTFWGTAKLKACN
jgi:hypothetical protein